MILSPTDRAALWAQTISSKSGYRSGMLRVLAKEMTEILEDDLKAYSGLGELVEEGLVALDGLGLIDRDDLRRSFEVTGIEDEGGGIPTAELALQLVGSLEEGASFARISPESRARTLDLVDRWRAILDSGGNKESPAEYVTVAVAAAHFKVPPRAVYKWCESGKIEFRKTPGGHYQIPTSQFDWGRGQDQAEFRREIRRRLAKKPQPALTEEEMTSAIRRGRGNESAKA